MKKPIVTSVILFLTIFPLFLTQAQVEPIPIEFLSEGLRVRGNFFSVAGEAPATTLLLVPGWPGNPQDVLGLGSLLASHGINVLMFNPRGFHQSEGTASFSNTLQDIRAGLQWLDQAQTQQRFHVDTARLALGGHSYGGGMAMAYAAADKRIHRLISIAGSDFGELIREFQRNAAFAQSFRSMLLQTQSPQGPARFDIETDLQELALHQDVYGLRENAGKLADRSILLIGGWEDSQVTIDQFMLPLYRALKHAGAADVTFQVYHDDHSFRRVRARLASDIVDWLIQRTKR
jgi:pimeloyl-ACP methyl ester carboxylesterase